jgi:aspartyl/asparaginyl beta-hydroxylase (cupin superfamily)
LRSAGFLREILNTLFYVNAGRDQRPVVYDVEKTYPDLLTIDKNYEVISKELDGLLPEQSRMRRYHDIDPGQEPISGADERAWRIFFVNVIGTKTLPTSDLCPRTTEIVGEIPNVMQAFFSILEPGKNVPSHNGVYFGYLRYHTAFRVPKKNPPTIRIKDHYHTWKEGESILFDDSWNHEVTNEAEEVRVVLIVDVMRPMPWPLHVLNKMWPGFKRMIGVSPNSEKFELTDPKEKVAAG